MGRKTFAKVLFNGTDITDDISPYLLSLTYTDNEEDESDDLQIKLQDRSAVWLTEWLSEAVNAQAGSDNGATSQSPAEGTATGSSYTVNAKSGLNMRTGPGTSYSKVGALAFGAQVIVTGTEGDWSIINHNGQNVYASTKYLSPAVGASSSSGTEASSYPTLRFGAQGDYVKVMQNALITKGQSLPKYGVDGYFGSETQSAVRAFQTAAGISVDGICGPITWQKLLGGSDTTQSSKSFYIQATIVKDDWDEDGELETGQFELDSITASGPPSTITMKAIALPYSSTIRQTKKSKAWESYTLQGIAQEMAANNGMSCMYESSYNPSYSHVEQTDESDISFLSKLAHGAGISLKATNNSIVLFDQLTYENIDSVLTIEKDDGTYEKYKLSTGQSETQYASCRVSYTSANGTLIEAIARVEDYNAESKNNQQLEIREKVSSVGEAQILASKYLRLRNKFVRTASFTLTGNTNIVAGVCVDLSGFGLWDGKYIVSQAKHTLSNGYTTTITLRNVLEGY